MPGEYDQLTAELDAILAKAVPVEDDDKRIEAAAEGADLPGAGEGDADADAEEGGDEGAFMKSFAVTLENGERAEAYDATLMIKAMHAQATRQAATIADLREKLEGADKVLAKLPEMLKALTTQIAEQGAQIKALREAPGGRQSVTAAPGATPGKATRGEILAKAMDAKNAGRISGFDAIRVETFINQGKPLPENLARAIGAA